MISIHAPAWGATVAEFVKPSIMTDFNPRARVGRDARVGAVTMPPFAFQSTRPRGARRCATGRTRAQCHFNPRARVGRDRARYSPRLLSPYFNPRARVGRDGETGWTYQHPNDFNPRARVGRDHGVVEAVLAPVNFNPRARVGRDRKRRGWHRDGKISIHAPAWGAT